MSRQIEVCSVIPGQDSAPPGRQAGARLRCANKLCGKLTTKFIPRAVLASHEALGGRAAPLREHAVREVDTPTGSVPRSETRSHSSLSWEHDSVERTCRAGVKANHACSSVGDHVPRLFPEWGSRPTKLSVGGQPRCANMPCGKWIPRLDLFPGRRPGPTTAFRGSSTLSSEQAVRGNPPPRLFPERGSRPTRLSVGGQPRCANMPRGIPTTKLIPQTRLASHATPTCEKALALNNIFQRPG